MEKEKSWKSYSKNQLPKGHFPNNIFRISWQKKTYETWPNPWKNQKKKKSKNHEKMVKNPNPWKTGGKSEKKK